MIRALLNRPTFAIGLLLMGLIALGVRGWAIWAEPMWLDEGYSAYAAAKGWDFLWQVVPHYETHPPFYYSLLRAWTLIAGDGLVAHRALGLVCGLATLPVVALAARRLARITGSETPRMVMAALMLAAVSPILVEMTREIRPYPVMILVYATATLALLAIAERRALGLPLAGRAYALYVACTALMLWLHNLGPLYATAMGLALLCVVRLRAMTKADWLWLLGGPALAILIWSPALFILLDQAPMWVKATWLKWSTVDLWRRATVMFTGPTDAMRVAAAVLALCGAAVLWTRRSRPLLAALLLLGLFPVVVSLIVSATIAPVFIIRTMTPLAIPAILLMAVGMDWGTPRFHGWRRWRRLVPLAALIMLCAQQFVGDVRARQHPKRDWYRTMEWLAPRFRPGDMVFAYPNEGALPFDRAVRDYRLAMPSRPIPTRHPQPEPAAGQLVCQRLARRALARPRTSAPDRAGAGDPRGTDDLAAAPRPLGL